jgi:hypothetical protein
MEIEMDEVEENNKCVGDLEPGDVFLLNDAPHIRVRLGATVVHSQGSVSEKPAVSAVNLQGGRADVVSLDPGQTVLVPVVAKISILVAHLR